ncbi:hypothetical protein TL16_g09839 [Triparma laevis f. inornata]|uniref:Uncharacterized protein n=1 Tax=Triparma laevis f. inornata TaxID=1714386 RepID=A0A9W7BDJ1_9STRA|nr:hypothetical protein TL16_g09839 [Triparma laevis f. inornata]
MGGSAENDLPEMDFDSDALVEEGKEGEIEEYKGYEENEGPVTGNGEIANLENQLGFQISAVKHPPFKFLAGPYCKRTKGKPGRSVTRALGNRKLKDSHEVLDKHGRRAFANPSEMDLNVELYGPKVSALDGLVIREVEAEPYMLVRACYERGAMCVMDNMEKFGENRHVVLFGVLSLGKMAIVETEDGVASPEAERAMDTIMKIVEDWSDNMAILSSSLGALASLSDNYANRIMMNEKKWMPLVVKLMKMVETETNEVYIRFSDGVKKVTMTSVSRHSIEMSINGSKLLFNMSCDEANREYVADSGLPLVTYVMKFCSEDATVQHFGCLALYDFVYRNEPAHYQANEEGILDFLKEVLSNFGGDDNLRKACKRTIAAMEPEGWRGNLGVKFDDSKM